VDAGRWWVPARVRLDLSWQRWGQRQPWSCRGPGGLCAPAGRGHGRMPDATTARVGRATISSWPNHAPKPPTSGRAGKPPDRRAPTHPARAI